MTTAADIVRMQADLLDGFRTRIPGESNGYAHVVQTASGKRIEYPVSTVGKIIDLLMFGPSGTVDEYTRPLFTSLNHTGREWAPPLTSAGIVGHGVAQARAYRIQENMTDAVLRRADALPDDTRFGLDEDQIRPPRPAGFAYFCEPVPHRARPGGRPDDPGIGLITWTAMVDMDEIADEPRELAWVVVVWDDVMRTRILGEVGRNIGREVPRNKQRFVPVTAFAITPGHLTGGPLLPIKQFGEAQMRSPIHTVAALWQLLGETIPAVSGDHVERVEQAAEEADRRSRRTARAAGVDEPEVTTVVLRRERRPVQNPGTGRKPEYRVEVDAYEAWRWVGSERLGTRKRVRRTIRKHWSCNDESLPVRERVVVSELRR